VTSRNSQPHPLTDLQQAILDVLWETRESTAEEIRRGLRPRHPLTDSSVRTLLRRLEARGLVEHRVEGKVFVYRAAIAAERLGAGAVKQIIRRFWGGSVEQFLTGMVDEELVSADELQRLAKKVRQRKESGHD